MPTIERTALYFVRNDIPATETRAAYSYWRAVATRDEFGLTDVTYHVWRAGQGFHGARVEANKGYEVTTVFNWTDHRVSLSEAQRYLERFHNGEVGVDTTVNRKIYW